MIIKAIVGSLIAFFLAVVLLRIDDSLQPEIHDLTTQAIFTNEVTGYTYLLGFDAPLGEDPLAVGKALQNSAVDGYLMEYGSGAPLDDESDLHCNTNGMQCLYDTFYGRDFELDWTNEQHELMRRYREFKSFDSYIPSVRTSHGAVKDIPEAFLKAQRLYLLDNFQRITLEIKKSPARLQALASQLEEIVREDNQHLRKLLVIAPTIRDKYRISHCIGDYLNSLMMFKMLSPELRFQPLDNLAMEERSLRLPAAYELNAFLSFNQTITIMQLANHDDSEEGAAFKAVVGLGITKAVSPYFFKENMVVNQFYQALGSAVSRSETSPEEFFLEAHSPLASMPLLWNVRTLGFVKPVQPSAYDKYVSYMFSLDAKIELFNVLAAGRGKVEDVFSPFVKDTGRAFYTTAKKYKACLPMPIEIDTSLNCLPVKLFN